MKFNPIQILANSSVLLLRGRAQFPSERIGQVIKLDDGRQYKIF